MLRTPSGVMLIDAGLGPRVTAQRMSGTGVTLRDVKAICLTHLDSDHFRANWLGTILNLNIKLFCHRTRVRDVIDTLDHEAIERHVIPFDDEFEPLEGVRARAIRMPHDRTGSHAFHILGFGCRLGYATDLGRVSGDLIKRFVDVDLLAIESNYDPEMQLNSPRPAFLKRRIMNGSGHLSNEQAFEAILKILDYAERKRRRLPRHIVLLHRSRQCNCPKLLRERFERDNRIASRLTLAEQYERTEWLRVRPSAPLIGEQLALSWGASTIPA